VEAHAECDYSYSEHKNVDINFFSPAQNKCPAHPKKLINLLCLTEKSKIYI